MKISEDENNLFPLMYGNEIPKRLNLKEKIAGKKFRVVKDCGFLVKIQISPEILDGEFKDNDNSLFIRREAVESVATTEYYSTFEEYYYSEWQS